MLITPKKAIELVLERKTKTATLLPYETKLQKYLFWLGAGALLVGALLAVVAYGTKNEYVVLVALFSLLAASLISIAYQLASVVPELVKLRNVEREMSDPLLNDFNDDIDLVNELASTCEVHHLAFARDRFKRTARQLRERISILVGALDKVGIVPIAVTGYLSAMKAKEEGLVPFGGIEWVLAGFVLLYLFAVRITATAQWMEKVAEIYSHSIAVKNRQHQQ